MYSVQYVLMNYKSKSNIISYASCLLFPSYLSMSEKCSASALADADVSNCVRLSESSETIVSQNYK